MNDIRNSLLSHDLIILFLFSRRFSRSTRLRCIFSASFSYRSFSSLAARLSLIPWIHFFFLLAIVQCHDSAGRKCSILQYHVEDYQCEDEKGK